MNPYTPIPRIVTGEHHLHLIHRILRPDVPPDTQRIDLITTSFKRVSLIDSGEYPIDTVAEGDTAVHVLWQKDESEAAIWIDEDRYPIAPGDTVMIPGGDVFRLSPNTLAILIAVRKHSLALPIPPTHGDYHFDGYNRESRYPNDAGFALSRWKVTQELIFSAPESERVMVSMLGNFAVQSRGGVTMLNQGEASVIRPDVGQVTLVPNGLSYVLVID